MSSTNSKLTRVADNIRILSASMVEKAKSGHPGGSMGGADFMTVLYTEFLRYDPDNTSYLPRSFLPRSGPHVADALFDAVAGRVLYDRRFAVLRQWGSVTPGHPEADFARGVENTSGPLGQGHAMALGAAIAERFMAARFGEWMAHKTYAYISDGAVEEEISQGVGRIAGHLGLSNFIMYYDSNNIQLSTKVDEVMTENVAMKYEAWGWNVLSVDGHNINEIREALVAANSETERPTLIIGRTVMGKGAKGPSGESFEDKVSTHGQPLTAAGAISTRRSRISAAIRTIRSPSSPRAAKPSPSAAKRFRAWAARQAEVEKTWRAEHGDLARKLDMFLSGRVPEIDYKSIEVKGRRGDARGIGCRAGRLRRKDREHDRGFCGPFELGQDGRLPQEDQGLHEGRLQRQILSGGSLGADDGLRGQRHGAARGVIPACGTFFVFSDYMKPAVRLSALMRLHVIYLDARLVPRWRGRSYASADRA